MDKLVALIVRIISACAGRAHVLPGVEIARYAPGQKLKVLLAGYNGARNTGSDVRVAALAEQILQLLGPDNVELSVMSFDTESTAPYFQGIAKQVPFSTVFFAALLKACSQHHVVVLCEGSTFKSKFADALTLYSCEAAGIMKAQGKPCVAYGGEVGHMAPFLESAVRDLCSDVFFMARSGASFNAARALGLHARHGTDTAWTFDSSRGHDEAMSLLKAGGWDGSRPLLAVAPVNPYWWPVTPSIAKWLAVALGDKRYLQFQKWYFFSWNNRRAELYRCYLDDIAAAVRTFCAERGFMPVVVGMEKLDEDACMKLASRLGGKGKAPVVLSKTHDGYVIGEVLRSADLLLTSRYHAQVLATDANVPAVAVSMDERLDNLAAELSLPDELLLHVDDGDLGPRALLALDFAHDNREDIAQVLADGRQRMLASLDQMGNWFQEYLESQLKL